MIQHTPGPFEVFREKTNQGVSYYIRKVDNGMVGEAFWNCLTRNEETAAANAALFAASPDMLNALRHAESWASDVPHGDNCFVSSHYEGDPGNQCNCGKDGLLGAISEAIAKATGSQP